MCSRAEAAVHHLVCRIGELRPRAATSLQAVSLARKWKGILSSDLVPSHLLDRDLRGGGSLREGYRSLPSCSRL